MFPFKIGCLPLNYSGNPGVNVESYWETPTGPGLQSMGQAWQVPGLQGCYMYLRTPVISAIVPWTPLDFSY